MRDREGQRGIERGHVLQKVDVCEVDLLAPRSLLPRPVGATITVYGNMEGALLQVSHLHNGSVAELVLLARQQQPRAIQHLEARH